MDALSNIRGMCTLFPKLWILTVRGLILNGCTEQYPGNVYFVPQTLGPLGNFDRFTLLKGFYQNLRLSG